MTKTIAVAITGASGAAYSLRLLECLVKADISIYLMLSQPGQLVINMETSIKLTGNTRKIAQQLTEYFQAKPKQIQVFAKDQWTAPIASGANPANSMVICPCTTGTLSSIACGASNNLLERAADVMLKEQRRLILVLRETPLSVIHLENMLKLAKMGALILPANPGFYHKPQSVQDIIDFIVARILDHLQVKHKLIARWGEA